MRIVSLFLSVFLNASAQVLIKYGFNSSSISKSMIDLATIKSIVLNAHIWGGLALYGIAALFWLYVLSGIRLSYAYPFMSLSYITVIFLSNIILKEPVSSYIWIGVILIVAGLSIIGFCAKG